MQEHKGNRVTLNIEPIQNAAPMLVQRLTPTLPIFYSPENDICLLHLLYIIKCTLTFIMDANTMSSGQTAPECPVAINSVTIGHKLSRLAYMLPIPLELLIEFQKSVAWIQHGIVTIW